MVLRVLVRRVLLILLLATPSRIYATEFTRTQLAFGDVPFSITIDCACREEKAFRLIAAGFAEVKKMGMIFSAYENTSELTKINSIAAVGGNVRVSRHMAHVLRAALQMTRITDRHFDLTFSMSRPDADAVKLSGRRLVFSHPGMRIDPTGLVKGYTVDLVMQRLRREKIIKQAVVAGSGDIAVFDRAGLCHAVRIKNPSGWRRNDSLSVNLCNQSVSTSGFYERGRHIRNTGGGKAEQLQVSVVASTTLLSDGLDNALMFMSPAQIRATLSQSLASEVVVMEKNGTVSRLKREKFQ